MSDRITPADLRELAGAAEVLVGRIDAAHEALLAEGATARARARFRLPEAAAAARRATEGLHEVADELARIAATPEHACGIEWGTCPKHGDTLTRTAGRATVCTGPGCRRTWTYDRISTPCPEPVTHRTTDSGGATQDVCTGHAAAARQRITTVTVDPLT